MSVRAQTPASAPDDSGGIDEHTASLTLGEGAVGFSNTNREQPLQRKFAVNFRASLAELQAKSVKAVWSPSQENLKSIFQQRQFVSLKGKSEMQGDLRQVVIHSIAANNVLSTFPVAVGARMTGVDENTFSSQGTGFSLIIPANQANNNTTTLQKDDVSIAYDFSQKYPCAPPKTWHPQHSILSRVRVFSGATPLKILNRMVYMLCHRGDLCWFLPTIRSSRQFRRMLNNFNRRMCRKCQSRW